MVEAFQNVVMRLALCGLGVSLAVMALRSRPVRDAFARTQDNDIAYYLGVKF